MSHLTPYKWAQQTVSKEESCNLKVAEWSTRQIKKNE